MTEKREVGLRLPEFTLGVFIALSMVLLVNRLERIADALERAYPAQEQTP